MAKGKKTKSTTKTTPADKQTAVTATPTFIRPSAARAAAKLPSVQKPMGRGTARKSTPVIREIVKEVEVIKEIEVVKEVEKKSLIPYVCIQHMGSESDLSEVFEKSKQIWQENNHSGAKLESMDLYVKPEDNAAYYVINGTDTGKVDLGM